MVTQKDKTLNEIIRRGRSRGEKTDVVGHGTSLGRRHAK